jgi:septal ring factor EnvC (AmiA/AmiB activator)
MGAFELFVIILTALVLIVKAYTTRDITKTRERLAEAETESKKTRGQLKILQFETAPVTLQLNDLEKTLSSQNQQILGLQTELGKIADDNEKLKAKARK